MITIFWLLVSALILIAFLIILPPLWRKRAVPADDQDQRNITIAAQRLAELRAQLQAGALSQDQYDEQFAELEAALSDDLDIAHPVKNVRVTRPVDWVCAGFGIAFGGTVTLCGTG